MILAVDGGNSKTDVALVALDGRLVAALRGPTTSHQRVGLEAGADRLAEQVTAVRSMAGLGPTDPPATLGAYGLAGADSRAYERQLLNAFAARGLATDGFVVNDTFAALRAGTDRGWGVVLICGSGINAAGLAPDGRTARLAALGEYSGDWGGGAGIGQAGLSAAVRARDRRGPRTSLETLVPQAYGLHRPLDVTWAFEHERLVHRDLDALSPVVFAAAAAGDAVARSIIDRMADELVAMAGAMIRRLNLTRLDPEVILVGGVFAARDEPMEARIGDGVRRVAPRATVRRSVSLPVVGAALLALDRSLGPGGDAHDAAAARLRASLGTWRPERS